MALSGPAWTELSRQKPPGARQTISDTAQHLHDIQAGTHASEVRTIAAEVRLDMKLAEALATEMRINAILTSILAACDSAAGILEAFNPPLPPQAPLAIEPPCAADGGAGSSTDDTAQQTMGAPGHLQTPTGC